MELKELLQGNTPAKCKGKNCSALGGNSHSRECRAEHDAAVHLGAGNRNPEARYKGYTGERLNKKASADERAAWLEGDRARKKEG